jgi:hypothetical protein
MLSSHDATAVKSRNAVPDVFVLANKRLYPPLSSMKTQNPAGVLRRASPGDLFSQALTANEESLHTNA